MAQILATNTVWSDDAPIVLTDDVQIAEGVTLTIEAGATIEGNGYDIQAFGALIARGAVDDVTVFRNVDVNFGENLFDLGAPPGHIEISHADIEGGSLIATFPQGKGSISLTDSLLEGVGGFATTLESGSIFARNVFLRTDGMVITDGGIVVENNAFHDWTIDFSSESAITAQLGGATVTHNSFLTTGRAAMAVGSGQIAAFENFFNTTDPTVIGSMILDQNDDLARNAIVDPSHLDAPHADTPTLLRYRFAESGVADPVTGFIAGAIGNYEVGSTVVAGGRTFRITDLRLAPDDDLQDSLALAGTAAGETLTGGASNDSLFGGLGLDMLAGGAGSDSADYQSTSMGVWASLAFGYASGTEIYYDLFGSIEAIRGGGGNDSLNGADLDDTLWGLGGDDRLSGNGGADELSGGDGNDLITGGIGDDRVDGGTGDDTLFGDLGADTIMAGSGIDYVDAGDGNDTIDGGDGTDTLHGGSGNDSVIGGGDYDFVSGSDGDDYVDGGAGADIVLGGTGRDTMTGGSDLDFDRVVSQTEAVPVEDIFLMLAPGAQGAGAYDQFENFETGVDRIDVSGAGATGFGDLGFSDYPGQGVKIIAPDGSAAFLLGIQQVDVDADWFLYA